MKYQLQYKTISNEGIESSWINWSDKEYNSYDEANCERIDLMRAFPNHQKTFVVRVVPSLHSTIRIHKIEFQTMADGPGLRNTVYCAGCGHHCKGCHNPQTWDFNSGQDVNFYDILEELLDDPYSNVTFSGGDPLYQVEEFTWLAKMIKDESEKTIWCYTGFTYDEVKKSNKLNKILEYIDVLVDGPYIEELKDNSLEYRGSSNQNIIFLNKK